MINTKKRFAFLVIICAFLFTTFQTTAKECPKNNKACQNKFKLNALEVEMSQRPEDFKHLKGMEMEASYEVDESGLVFEADYFDSLAANFE